MLGSQLGEPRNYFPVISMWSMSVNVTDGQTDWQTTFP